MYDSIICSFMSPAQQKAREEQERAWAIRQFDLAVPWDEQIKWKDLLVIKAETYRPRQLFKVKPLPALVNDAKKTQLVVSPCNRWAYCERRLPSAYPIPTAYGRERGKVIFDGPVSVPALYEVDEDGERWKSRPWMSITPMEIMTLRPGTRRARGKVIVAGLGLGHQLIEVSKRKQVQRLVLVEKDRSLVDWLMPKIKPFLGSKVDEVVVGDAYKALPKMTADVALVDIFPSYGGNEYSRDRLAQKCPRIKVMWGWGAYA